MVLSEPEIAALLATLPHWRRAGAAIERDFRFTDFSAAWGFMSRAALLAEAMGHHPDWSNSYNRVHVSLTTHDAGGVTAKDAALARGMEALV